MTLEDNSIGHAYSFIVTRQGSFVAHPDKSLTFQSTLKDYFKDIAPKDKRNLAENILTIEDEDGEFGLFRGANDKIFIGGNLSADKWTNVSVRVLAGGARFDTAGYSRSIQKPLL